MTKDRFQREERYIVFKMSDVEEHFTPNEKQHLERLVEVQRAGREEARKSPLDCVVVESDWPEYEPTWRAIETRVTGAQAQNAPSVPDDVRKDAERYRFLEHLCATGSYGGIISRKAIDAAMLAAATEAKS